MNSHSRKWIVLNLMIGACLLTCFLNGCALLSPNMTEEEMYENDPVGRAALALRQDRSPAGETPSASGEISQSQLTLGMSSYRVRSLWGQPQEIENAGDPASGNQRWIYLNGLKRGWGTSDYRVVYFERNQVVGWENHR
ncbi:MAG: hypothetical protein ACJ763_07075 [Bdellovibrionia bacterium]